MDTSFVHALSSWVGSLVGTASVPAIVAALAWKYRATLMSLVEKQIAARLDHVVANTALGKQIASIETKLSILSGEPVAAPPVAVPPITAPIATAPVVTAPKVVK